MLEVLIACIEICDPDRRAALGMPAPAEFDERWDRPFHGFAVTWFGSRVVARLRQLLLRSSLAEEQLQNQLQRLGEAERKLLRDQDETRRQCREALCALATDSAGSSGSSRSQTPAHPQPSPSG